MMLVVVLRIEIGMGMSIAWWWWCICQHSLALMGQGVGYVWIGKLKVSIWNQAVEYMESESLNVSMIVFKMMLRVVFGLEIGMRMSIARWWWIIGQHWKFEWKCQLLGSGWVFVSICLHRWGIVLDMSESGNLRGTFEIKSLNIWQVEYVWNRSHWIYDKLNTYEIGVIVNVLDMVKAGGKWWKLNLNKFKWKLFGYVWAVGGQIWRIWGNVLWVGYYAVGLQGVWKMMGDSYACIWCD